MEVINMYQIEMTKQLRPVIINFDVEGDKRGLFHGWFPKTGHYSGSLNNKIDTLLFGIIELPSGEIITIKASDFKFVGSEKLFDSFMWDETS
jgi:hypothetical protein